MNACKIYGKCKSKELITSFNQSSLCISYHSMKRHWTGLAKYVIKKTHDTEITVPLPSHFSASSFTLSAFDNFDHNDNSSLSGKKSTHDTAIKLFQVKPSTPVNKPLKSEVNLSSINSFSPLPCQIISKYNLPKQLILPESFSVEEQIYECQPKINESENCNFILSAVSALPNQCEQPLTPLTWAATKSLLSKSVVPKMQVAFLPFIPKPVTDYSTVYTALYNLYIQF